MPKQTRLDDNAQIYHPLKQQSEKEKLREMTFHQKLSYLWDYYKLYALAVVAAILLISYFIYNTVTPDIKTKFYAAMIDNSIDAQILEQYQADFSEYLNINPKRENIQLNSSFYLNSDTEYSMNMNEIFTTYLSTGQIDVIIAPESVFSKYCSIGYLDKLSEQLPTDIYSSLTDYFYIAATEDDPDKDVYGIILSDTELYKNHSVNSEPYILGIVPNSKNKDNSIEFLKYLFKK
jgi:hypothetical protein